MGSKVIVLNNNEAMGVVQGRGTMVEAGLSGEWSKNRRASSSVPKSYPLDLIETLSIPNSTLYKQTLCFGVAHPLIK